MRCLRKTVLTWAGWLSLCGLLVFACGNIQAQSGLIVAGKDYRALTPSVIAKAARIDPIAAGHIQVAEFFSYGCPACYHLEPTMEKWVKTKPDNVIFQPIPVTFQPGWKLYAKAYYAGDALGILNKLTPAMFKAIHVQHRDLANTDALATLFAKEGVDATTFNAIFEQSTALDLAINKGDQLMQLYGINVVPTVVIGQRYVTSIAMTHDADRLLQTIDFLVKKSKSA